MPTRASARPAAVSSARPTRGPGRRLALSEKVAGGLLVVLVFLAVIAFGASEIGTAALFSGVYAAYLIGLLATCNWARRDLVRMRGKALQAGLFALLLLAVLWPLTPWAPGGPHPVWAYLPDQTGSVTVDRSALLLNVLQLLGLACLFTAGRVLGASEARGRWCLRIAVMVFGAFATLAFLDHVLMRRSSRLVATLLSPNSAATMLGGGLLLAVAATANRVRRQKGLAMLRRGDPESVICLAIAGVSLTALLMTASRAGLAATLVGLGLLLIWEAIAQRQRFRVVAGLGSAALLLVIGALSLRSTEQVAERFNNAQQDAEVRAAIIAPHWEAFLASPWFGYGLGSFPTLNHMVSNQQNLPVLFDVRAVHNLYVQWLEDAGVAGAAAMALLFLVLLWPILRGGLREGVTATWARATVCAAVVFLLHGLTDFALQVPAIQALVALVLGLAVSLSLGTGSARKTDPPTVWTAAVAAAAVLTFSVLGTTPLLAARVGSDLTAWPTAPADALGREIEISLARPNLPPVDLTRLEQLSQREVALRPASGAAWLRRAAVSAARGQAKDASQALERSYAVAPLQTSLFVSRTKFAYEHWDQISPEAREAAIYQFETEWHRRPDRARYAEIAKSLRNQAGRVAMAVQIFFLQLEPPRAP
ncbi:O-antigen ligase family protein [Caulobacter henricii]|uniref:O-antigen ligase-related domain-containing protein n=1 Tax=Caulobacter henricii TaxID=69395 RepID=A0A0P0P2W9_9CAUL|nr:O-antigen ligase family protein [Caulobacter henricii]ALL14893.1 hypothetical protein AQ619_16825 [Caulobacter henricii]